MGFFMGYGGLGRAISACVVVVCGGFSVGAAPIGDWQSAGVLALPEHNYTFISTTPSGDLLAATFNRGEAKDPPKMIPALLIKNPTSGKPTVVELCTVAFASTRGYGGIAADSGGAFFVSGDTGDGKTGFVRKFGADGKPDVRFGRNGVLLPGRRCLGVEVFGGYLLLAVDWGQIKILDSKTGRDLGETTKTPQLRYMRDIAIDPRSMRLFGVASAGVISWGGAAPWKPAAYVLREFRRPQTAPIVAEGISVDPFKRTILINPPDGGELLEIHGDGRIVPTRVTTSVPKKSHLTDSAISADGSTLFISDYKQSLIHVMKRPAPDPVTKAAEIEAAAPEPAVAQSTGKVPPTKWNRSYFEILPQARQARQPMLIYFRRAGVKPCERFEKGTLLTDEFNKRSGKFACVFEEASLESILRVRFGVVRLPTLFLLDGDGNTVAELRGAITGGELFRAMDR